MLINEEALPLCCNDWQKVFGSGMKSEDPGFITAFSKQESIVATTAVKTALIESQQLRRELQVMVLGQDLKIKELTEMLEPFREGYYPDQQWKDFCKEMGNIRIGLSVLDSEINTNLRRITSLRKYVLEKMPQQHL